MTSLGFRIAATVIVGVCWLSFVLLFFAFGAGSFNFWQNLAILVVSVIVAAGIVAVTWIKWALK